MFFILIICFKQQYLQLCIRIANKWIWYNISGLFLGGQQLKTDNKSQNSLL